MRTLTSVALVGALTLVVGLSPLARADDDEQPAAKPHALVGKWRAIRFEGRPYKEGGGEFIWHFFADGKLEAWQADAEGVRSREYSGTWKAVDSAAPRQLVLDLTEKTGREVASEKAPAIYEIDAKTGELAIMIDDKEPYEVPLSFEPSKGHDLLELERIAD